MVQERYKIHDLWENTIIREGWCEGRDNFSHGRPIVFFFYLIPRFVFYQMLHRFFPWLIQLYKFREQIMCGLRRIQAEKASQKTQDVESRLV